MQLTVGCPIRNRAWCFPQWIESVSKACDRAGVSPSFVFVLGPSDDGTEDLVSNLDLPSRVVRVAEADPPLGRGERRWNVPRYEHLAALRNRLLSVVRDEAPSVFLSLDSDILLHEDALTLMFDTLETHPARPVAVGGKTYLSTHDRQITNYAMLPTERRLVRQDRSDVITVDVLMAIKLMKPAAYQVPYAAHPLGEDIGWSLGCRARGFPLVWDGRITSQHLML